MGPDDQSNNANAYQDYDGRLAIRLLEPTTDSASLAWLDDGANVMQSQRWYPGAENLADGSIVLIGGATSGGYINRNNDSNAITGGSNPTYEYFPSNGQAPRESFSLSFCTFQANLLSPLFRFTSSQRTIKLHGEH